MKLGASLPAYRTFALEDLQEATHNFDDSTLLGEGSHGQVFILYSCKTILTNSVPRSSNMMFSLNLHLLSHFMFLAYIIPSIWICERSFVD